MPTKYTARRANLQAQNRAQRRANKSEWARRMKGLHQDGGGVFSIDIILPTSPLHPRAMVAIAGWIQALQSGEIRPLCLDCDREFSLKDLPVAFMLITPARPDPSIVSLTGICIECMMCTPDELIAKALKRARAIWPDARELPSVHMHGHGGRA